ncbi:MAG: S8 family serine peptidase [Caldilineaceae bacterium]|nr:S8 family serine peptidase [Caldilineaceae bacterium]
MAVFRRWVARLRWIGLLWLGAVLVTTASHPLQAGSRWAQVRGAQVTAEVQNALATTGVARVLVLLDDQGLTEITAASARQAAIAQRQAQVLSALTATDFQRYRQYQTLPGFAGTTTAAGLATLQAHPLVRQVQLDHAGGAHLQQSLPALGGNLVHSTYGITGQGITVAVLDSGIDTDHPDLADAVVAQHCFTNGNCPPNGAFESTSAEDENGHGTHVAGVITANGVVSGPGFAPAATIMAVRGLDGGGGGFVSDWIAGLDWIYSQLPTTPVRIVNLSLGTYALYSGNCDAQEPLMAAAVRQLYDQGVTLFASTGNQGSSTQISSPACNSGVIAVGATYDGNVGRQPTAGTYQANFGGSWPNCADTTTTLQKITCFTNSNAQLDLLAPGAPIRSAYVGGGAAIFWGTSQASPTAAGIAALLLEQKPDRTPTQIESLLKASGPPLTDSRNGLAFPQVNALNAIKALAPVGPTAVTLAGPTTGKIAVAYTFTALVTPITVTTPLTYHWQATDRPAVTQVGAEQQTQTWQWSSPGPKMITVTVANASMAVTVTHALTIAAVAPQELTVTGPLTLATGMTGTWVAAVTPLTVTVPLTYHWQPSTQPPITQLRTITAAVVLAWPEPGTQQLTVTAANARGAVSVTRAVTIAVVAPITVTLAGPINPVVGVSTTVTAHVWPGASLPITYTWQATGQAPIIRQAGRSDTVVYRWWTTAPITVSVQVQNRGGVILNQQGFVVTQDPRLYLPVIVQP